MMTLRNKCKLDCNIETYKERLDTIIIIKNYNFLDDEVIELSQFIDQLIYDCILGDANDIYNFKKKSSPEPCEILYYYGKQYLFLNLYYYISEGIRNDELIYISMKEDIYDQLIEELKINRLPVKDVKLKNLDLKVRRKNEYSSMNFKENVNTIFLYDKKKYKGIRWVIDPLNNTDSILKKYLMDLETLLNKYNENSELNILSIYDVYEYMYKYKIINNKLMNRSDDIYYNYSEI